MPRDRAVLEAVVDDSGGDTDTLVFRCISKLVRNWIAERTPLPADFALFVVNPAVNLVRLRFQRPVDRAALETVEATSPVRADSLVAQRATDEVRSKSLMIAHSKVCISRIWSTRRVHKIRKIGRAP
jgi:hypothetical protein